MRSTVLDSRTSAPSPLTTQGPAPLEGAQPPFLAPWASEPLDRFRRGIRAASPSPLRLGGRHVAETDEDERPELDPTYGDAAKTIYEEVVARYPGTPAAQRAGLRLTELNEMYAEKELRNALFYVRFKAYDSAILLLRSLIASYPRTQVIPDALEHLVKAYQKLNYQEDVKETCNYIRQYHPEPGGPIRWCKEIANSE